ncbi:hypothetical protein FOA52_006878 [Chlamydomonas sp. UWO 241]|nr:hypothetical protein FOA52_006878 [Chlamydomonas sp. UWO 241]
MPAPQPVASTSDGNGGARPPASKRITSHAELKRFLDSDSARSFFAFVLSLNEAVSGKKASDACAVSPPVQALLDLLASLSAAVDEIPPVSQSLRYGNPAYRSWFVRMVEGCVPGLQRVLPPGTRPDAVQELAPYWADSFGNSTRIDYGTGHETNFVALLFCLARLGVVQEADRQALVTRVFAAYITLMRKVQTTYWLEPAGSHGVWGLDDYQMLPFLWGASQLMAHPMIKPKSIHNPDVLEAYSGEYLYLAAIKFVKQVKKGSLSETSPIINDISSVATWSKVNSGMAKMYAAEVLSKLPIMQHFLFCSLLPFQDAEQAQGDGEAPDPSGGGGAA